MINPRYANYARAHGRTPDEQLKVDREEWPGGLMCGFVQWSNARLLEARREVPDAFYMTHLIDHAIYDAWLTAWVDKHVSKTTS